MELVALDVASFGCIEAAEVSFGSGLNVLFGPNDLGKSTLASAIRAVLLLQPGASVARDFVPWHSGKQPEARLTFRADGELWRVTKVWASGRGGSALLERSREGRVFVREQEGRAVDGRLRALLGWGIPEPGGRGGQQGVPRSFLSTVLLGEQALPAAVFEQGLCDDPVETGRERLTEALAALAQDPLFKEVLGRAQAKVDEAFTPGGKRKRGKGSPFARTAEEVKHRQELYEALAHRVHETEAVAARLAELDRERDRLTAARAEAEEQVEAVARDLERITAREGAQREHQAALERLRAADAAAEEVRRLETEVATRQADLPALEARLREAEQAEQAAEAVRQRLAQRVTEIRAGGSTEAQLERAALETKRLRLQADLDGARACVEAIAAVHEAAAEVEALRTRIEAVQAKRVELAAARAPVREALERALADEILLQGASRWRAWTLARDELVAAEQAHAAAERNDEQARALEAEVAEIRERLAAHRLPPEATRQALIELHDALRLARARMGGGLEMKVELSGSTPVVVRRDDGALQPSAPPHVIEADRFIELHLGDLACIRVQGGDPRARREAAELEARFAREAEPWLQAAEARDFAALQRAWEAHDRLRIELERKQAQADQARRLARATREGAGDLEARRQRLSQAEARLQGVDPQAARRFADEHGDAIETAIAARQQAASTRRAELEALDRQDQSLRTDQEVLQAQRARAEATLRTLREKLGTEASDLEEAKKVLSRLDGERSAIDEALARLAQHEAQAHDEAQTELARAEASLGRARQARVAAAEAVDAMRDALAKAKGALDVRREQVQAMDTARLCVGVDATRAALDALPKPRRDVTTEDLDRARERLQAIDASLEDVMRELRQQEGALQQVGGDVIRQKAEAAREAVDAARRRESEVELDFEAWKLLLETLRAAENEEGRHLGEALGERVGARFQRLTQGRYGALRLDADLKAEGLETQGGIKKVEVLSEGLKEQLATILRVSVAEQLRGVLVLDDHLTQTDPGRLAWFRDFLREAAQSIQIVVITCRPLDYLDTTEMPPPGEAVFDAERLRAVDLGRAIRRVAPEGDRPAAAPRSGLELV